MGTLTRTEQIDALTENEREALFRHTKTGAPPLSPETNARLFELYLMGKTLDQIQRTNKAFTLGMMVQAKIDGDWDNRLVIYQQELLDGVKERVKQTQLEAIYFVSDQLSFTHAKFRKAMLRYLETGDEGELGGLVISNPKQYRETIELLLQLTGQDNPTKKTESKVTHKVEVVDAQDKAKELAAPAEPPSAGSLLRLLDSGEK